MDKATEGKITVDGTDLSSLNPTQAAIFRRRKVGLIYQFYNLIPTLTVEKNILMPLTLDKKKPNREYSETLVNSLGLSKKLSSMPGQLSLQNYGTVEKVKTTVSSTERTTELYFRDKRAVFRDMENISSFLSLPPGSVSYNEDLLSLYLVRSPSDPAPRLLLPLFLLILLLACFSLIIIVHNAFSFSMNGQIHHLGVLPSIGATPSLEGALIWNKIRDVTNPDFRHPRYVPYLKEKSASCTLLRADREETTAKLPILSYTETLPTLREVASTDYYELVHILPVSLWEKIRGQIGGGEEDTYICMLAEKNASLEALQALQDKAEKPLGEYGVKGQGKPCPHSSYHSSIL